MGFLFAVAGKTRPKPPDCPMVQSRKGAGTSPDLKANQPSSLRAACVDGWCPTDAPVLPPADVVC